MTTRWMQEVCGLKWSPDGRFLASGGNDNRLCIWAAEANERHSAVQPLHVLTEHQAAVKVTLPPPFLSLPRSVSQDE